VTESAAAPPPWSAAWGKRLVPVLDAIEAGGVATYAGIAEELNRRAILTSTGAPWYTIEGLVKLGFIWPDEQHDLFAIIAALNTPSGPIAGPSLPPRLRMRLGPRPLWRRRCSTLLRHSPPSTFISRRFDLNHLGLADALILTFRQILTHRRHQALHVSQPPFPRHPRKPLLGRLLLFHLARASVCAILTQPHSTPNAPSRPRHAAPNGSARP